MKSNSETKTDLNIKYQSIQCSFSFTSIIIIIDTLRLKRIVWNSMPFQCILSNYKICSSHIVTNQQTYPSKNKSSIFGKFRSPFTAFTARSVFFFFFFFFLSFHTKLFLFAHWPLYSFGYSVIVENYLFFLHIAVSPLDVKPLTTAKNT